MVDRIFLVNAFGAADPPRLPVPTSPQGTLAPFLRGPLSSSQMPDHFICRCVFFDLFDACHLRKVPQATWGNRTFRSNPFCDLVNSDEQFVILQLKRIVERKERPPTHVPMADMRLANQCIGVGNHLPQGFYGFTLSAFPLINRTSKSHVENLF